MISIIIPSYNSESTIGKCITSLKNQLYADPYEVILVDSSVDKTPEIVASFFPDITFYHFDQKTDPGTARNRGLEMAQGKIIAFIDSDCAAREDWLLNISRAHQSAYNIIGGVVENGNNPDSSVAWAGYLSEFREFIPGQERHEVNHIPTCNISYKKKIFDTYGNFNGKYYPQEDLLFNHMLIENHEKILLDPAVVVYHNHRTVLSEYLRHQKRIGEITAVVLKMLPLQGAFIARNRPIAVFIIPLLPFVKFAKTVFIFLKYQPKVILKYPLSVMLFSLGLFYWVRGFFKGTMKN